MALFGKKPSDKGRKKKAAAFVDFEHWVFSLSRQYAMKPDIRTWYKSLADKYDLVDVFFFGDFSNPLLRNEIPKIREITTGLIETQNASPHIKKDFTDFIMLDHIYQRAFLGDVDVFVLFTGDGHFSSVVSYLVNKRRKDVEIFGISGAISQSLKNTATLTTALPSDEDLKKSRELLLLRALKKIYETAKSPRPTYQKTIEAVAKESGVDSGSIEAAMESIVEKGYVYQTKKYFAGGRFIKILALNSALIKNDGLWELL